jgi:hypothetical protein
MVVACWRVLRGSGLVKRHGIDAVGMSAIESRWRRGRVKGRDGDEVGVCRPGVGSRTRLIVARAAAVVVAVPVALAKKSVGPFGLKHAFRNVDGIFEAASGCCAKLWAHDSKPV